MAVVNWPAQAVLEAVDILIFQYQELQDPAMRASRDAYVAAGKRVWGYHCVSPTPSVCGPGLFPGTSLCSCACHLYRTVFRVCLFFGPGRST